MSPSLLIPAIIVFTAVAYQLGLKRSHAVAGPDGPRSLHSRPIHYAVMVAMACAIPALMVFAVWHSCQSTIITQLVVAELPENIRSLPANRLNLVVNDIRNLVVGNVGVGDTVKPEILEAVDHYRSLSATSSAAMAVIVLLVGVIVALWARSLITPELRARNHVERIVRYFLILSSSFAIFTTIGIVLSVLFEALRFFKSVPLTSFLFGLEWSPQMAIRADQVGSSGAFGAVPVFAGTMLISAIAMLVSVPLGLMSAIYLSEYSPKAFRAVAKPLLEILAGIPTVVYGFFAALTVAPFIRESGAVFGLDVSSESALAAGLVMGIMIIPFVSSLSDDVINAVPQSMRDGAYALGATKSETIRQVVIPAALPGIVGGILLAVSRAIGETMIVVMAAGMAAKLTANPLQAVTTVTVQIVSLLVGDQEFDSPKTLAAFALGLILFIATLILNIIALYVVRKYREQYE
ncbi:MAG: phosphate ABC transporter permease subunit PstC [Proteobacteria bacterium]|nr:phosphate ABC transporter permease subunit PstC [Pseudomonadota bacterium]MBU1686847.1 phosphate ABC transporter permease subunit PstC [Pseudomonadota bacterium]